jgi:hypothetical protein
MGSKFFRRLETFCIPCLIGPEVSKSSALTIFLGQIIPLGQALYPRSGQSRDGSCVGYVSAVARCPDSPRGPVPWRIIFPFGQSLRLSFTCPCGAHAARAARSRAVTDHVLFVCRTHCNMCNTQFTFETSRYNTCNLRLKTNETLETRFWNTCKIHIKTIANIRNIQIKTLRTHVWNVCSIQLNRLATIRPKTQIKHW